MCAIFDQLTRALSQQGSTLDLGCDPGDRTVRARVMDAECNELFAAEVTFRVARWLTRDAVRIMWNEDDANLEEWDDVLLRAIESGVATLKQPERPVLRHAHPAITLQQAIDLLKCHTGKRRVTVSIDGIDWSVA